MEKKYKYMAFISYRHLAADMEIAQKVQQMIEQFKVPNSLDSEGKYKDLRVFRDRDELTTKDLYKSIDDALKNSEFLIVILSKRTKLSKWCMREIEEFRKTHSDNHIIPVLIEGEPYESFPDQLSRLKSIEIDDKGEEVSKDLELLAADLRASSMKTPFFEGYEILEKEDKTKLNELVKESIKILKTNEIYRIMATILGVNFGDLKQRNRERKLKRIISLSILAAISLALVALGMTSLYFKADSAQKEAVEQNSLMSLKSAEEKLKEGNRAYSILIADEAIKKVDENMPGYEKIVADYDRILNDAIFAPKYSSKLVLETNSATPLYSIVKENKEILVAGELNLARVYDIDNGKILKEFEFDSGVTGLVNSDDYQNSYISTQDGTLFVIDNQNYEIVDKFKINPLTNTLVVSSDNKYISTNIRTNGYEIYDIKSHEKLVSENSPTNLSNISLLDKGKYIVVYDDSKIKLNDVNNKSDIKLIADNDKTGIRVVSLSKDKNLLAYTSKDGISIYDIEKNKNSTLPIKQAVSSITFNNENNKIYVSGYDDISAYSIDGKFLETYNIPRENISYMKFDNAGNNLYMIFDNTNSIGLIENIEDQTIDSMEKKVKRISKSEHKDKIYSLFITEDDKNLITASNDSTIKIASSISNLSENLLAGNIKAVSEDKSKLYTIDKDYKSYIYDFSNDNYEYIGTLSEKLALYTNRYAISNDGTYFAISIPSERIVRVFDKTGKRLFDSKKHQLKSNSNIQTDIINDVKINNKTKTLYSLGEDGVVYLTDLTNGNLLKEIGDRSNVSKNMVISEDGSILAINYSNETCQVYDVKKSKKIKDFKGEVLYLSGREANIDLVRGSYGRRLFKYENDKITTFESNDERIQISGFNHTGDPETSLDGSYLLNGIKGKLVITDLKTGLRVKSLQTNPEQTYNVPDGVMSFDNSKIIYNYDDNNISIVDNLSSKELKDEAKKIIGDRKLSKQEKVDLGMVDRREDEK